MYESALIATAIDRLNSWVRSDSARPWFSSPRYAIYDWKRNFIETCILAGRCDNVRAIRLSLTCRDCRGSKRYTNSLGHTYDWCRKCDSTGTVTLRFLVTTIHGFTWHTPERETWRIRLNLPEDFWQRSELSVDWEPNQKGIDLTTDQVAQWLNVLEAEYPNVPTGHMGHWDDDDDYLDHKKYRLYLGKTREVCAFCNGERDEVVGSYYHVMRPLVEWSAWCCDTCRVLRKAFVGSIFDLFPIPVDLIQFPEITKWLANRAGRKAA